MRSIQLNISDSMYDKFMFFLNTIPKKSIEIISDSSISKKIETNHEDNNHLINSSVNTIKDWQDESEDEIWK